METKIPEKLEEILSYFSMLKDENEKMLLLVDYADKFQSVPESIAKKPYPNENKVEYCESEAYVWCMKQNDNTLKFYLAVENPNGISAKALCSILDKTISGLTAEEIIKIPTDIVYNIFGDKLSMGKNLGLAGILNKIKSEASKYQNNFEF
jgi:sulfur transfer protein SufE